MQALGVTALLAAASWFAGSVAAAVSSVDPIVIKGSKFFYKTNGTQFYIRGMAYQSGFTGSSTLGGTTQTYSDPLANPAGCKRDIPYLVELRTNALRVYQVDPTADHDECMSMLADAGIYVVLDLSAPTATGSINRANPSWNVDIYDRYASVVDTMQKYTNTLGFFAGNEVSNAPNNTYASPFVKAAVRDMKTYIKNKGYRDIGVGYATDDNQFIRVQIHDYFNCGDQADAIDFWGYNIYSWCGDSTYAQSGYQARTEEFESYSVPAFFAEYGCNTVEPRPFTEVLALYGPNMSPVWSGGFVFEYFQATNNYGLVTLNGGVVETLTDFNNLKTQIAKVHPTGVVASDYTPTNTPASCPAETGDWHAAATPLPPTPNAELCACMMKSLSCVVNPNVSPNKYHVAYSYIGGKDAGAFNGIQGNGIKGQYGAYEMCTPAEKLSFVLNQYYKGPGKSESTACNFNGVAQQQTPSSASSQCKALLGQAGAGGTGTVTSAPSGTGAGAAGAGSSGSASSAASSSGSGGIHTAPMHETGILPAAVIAVVAALSGMGMLML